MKETDFAKGINSYEVLRKWLCRYCFVNNIKKRHKMFAILPAACDNEDFDEITVNLSELTRNIQMKLRTWYKFY